MLQTFFTSNGSPKKHFNSGPSTRNRSGVFVKYKTVSGSGF